MDHITSEIVIPDKFYTKMAKMSYSDFECDYELDIDHCSAESQKKFKRKLKNDYNNRMRPSNLRIYYMFEKITGVA
jgi:hypothetical protein